MRIETHRVNGITIGNPEKHVLDDGREFWTRRLYVVGEKDDIELVMFAWAESDLGITEGKDE